MVANVCYYTQEKQWYVILCGLVRGVEDHDFCSIQVEKLLLKPCLMNNVFSMFMY